MNPTNVLERYFLETRQRTPPLPQFCRIIGRDEEGNVLTFLKKYHQLASSEGLYISGTIRNPEEAAIQRFYTAVGQSFVPSGQTAVRHLAVWLGQVRPAQRSQAATAVGEALDQLKAAGANENILKNAYVKFMCWMRDLCGKVLNQVGGANPPKVLYEGDISKYELYLLYILAKSGCDVVYLNFQSEASYLKTDPKGRFSIPVRGPLLSAPERTTDSSKPQTAQTSVPVRSTIKNVEGTVVTNSWSQNADFMETVLLSNQERSKEQPPKLCNLFVLCFGVDQKDAYRNRLYHLRKKLQDTGRSYLLLDHKVENPSNEEIAPFKGESMPDRQTVINGLAAKLQVEGGAVQQALAKAALIRAMESTPEANANRLYNQGVRLACWLKRYADRLFSSYRAQFQPVVIYYGAITPQEITLLWMLKEIGVDVLYFSPEKEGAQAFEGHPLMPDGRRLDLPEAAPLEPFPDREVRTRVATVAYNASQELDQVLYTDTGMYRNRQFVRSSPVTLKTTYDEIGILWDQEAKYRPSFETTEDVVKVPNIFAKISGIENGNRELYWDKIQDMITPDTLLITQVPFHAAGQLRINPNELGECIRNGRLDAERIKKCAYYHYEYLPETVQDYLLEKMQDLLDYNILQNVGYNPERAVLAVLLNLDKTLLRRIQNFDFTKAVPKVLIVDVTEALFTLENCILLAFLNLVGFDIAIFTPTGYRNLEQYISPECYESYQIGEYEFSPQIPNFKTRKKSAGSSDWLGKIFGRGRS